MADIQEKRCKRFHKEKLSNSICIYAMIFIVGWIRGLFGPSFIDIQIISDVTLKLGSWISTMNFVGYAVGCLLGGIIYDIINLKLVYGIGLLLVGMVTASVPWCSLFVLMAAAHFGQGFGSGIVDTVGNAHMMEMWPENKMMFFFMEFSYFIGAFLAPIIVAPFLSDNAEHKTINETSRNATLNMYSQNTSTISTVINDMQFPTIGHIGDDTSVNLTSGNLTTHTEGHIVTSRLFVPYSISAALAVLVSFSFFFKYFMTASGSNADISNMSSTEKQPARILPKHLKVVCLILISSVLLLSTSLGDGFVSFIVVYCVEEIGFSPADGALVSAVSNVCCIAAIIVAIFASRLNTLVYLGIHISGTLVGVTALLFSSIGHSNLGVWISSAIVGYFRSMIFSLSFTWTNSYISPTTGKIASLFMVCTCTGSAVIPLLLGWLMDEYSNLWFCFLLIIFGVCVLLLFVVGVVLTKYVTTSYGKTFRKTALVDMSLTERLNKDINELHVKWQCHQQTPNST